MVVFFLFLKVPDLFLIFSYRSVSTFNLKCRNRQFQLTKRTILYKPCPEVWGRDMIHAYVVRRGIDAAGVEYREKSLTLGLAKIDLTLGLAREKYFFRRRV